MLVVQQSTTNCRWRSLPLASCRISTLTCRRPTHHLPIVLWGWDAPNMPTVPPLPTPTRPSPHPSVLQTKRFEGDAHHSLVMRPNTDVMVFAQALADVGQVAQGREGDTALVSKGDQLVVQYSSIAPYVASGQMCLK